MEPNNSILSSLTASPHNATSGHSILGNISTVLGTLILVVVFLLGCPGNFFIIWSILARVRKRSITTLLILHLACADGFVMTLAPFFVVYLAKRTWLFGNVMCKVLFYLCNANMYASILLIMLMSLYRLVAIVWPQRIGALAGRRTVLRVLPALWMVVLFISSPALIFRREGEEPEGNGSFRTVCVLNHSIPEHVVLHYSFETSLGFLLPYGVIVTSYFCILRRIQRTKFRRRMRSEKLILAIVVTFGLFWLPYHVISVVQIAAALCSESNPLKERLDYIWESSRTVVSTLAFVSSCANPVLYSLAGKAYIRQAGLAFMARLFERTDSGTRKRWQTSQDSRPRGQEGQELDDKEAESTASNSAGKIER